MKSYSSPTCHCAALYFYDFLYHDAESNIPKNILSHISQCSYCKFQINRLRNIIFDRNDLSAKKTQLLVLIKKLKLHFSYVNAPVTCGIAKLFFISLSDSICPIRIPTPITVHIESCQPCNDDLKTIVELNLTEQQLGQLENLLKQSGPQEVPASFNLNRKEVQRILDRPQSGVITRYNFDDNISIQEQSFDNIYSGWPMTVQINKI